MTRPEPPDDPVTVAIRLDKWLVFARFFRTRALAAQAVGRGPMRVNGTPTTRPDRLVRPGDVLTFAQGGRIRVVRILAPALRRGPAALAQALYDDLDPVPVPVPDPGTEIDQVPRRRPLELSSHATARRALPGRETG